MLHENITRKYNTKYITQKYNMKIQKVNTTYHFLFYFTTSIQHKRVYTTQTIQLIIHIQHEFCTTRLYNMLIHVNQKNNSFQKSGGKKVKEI